MTTSAPAVWHPKPQFVGTLHPVAVLKEHRDLVTKQIAVYACQDVVTNEKLEFPPSTLQRFFDDPEGAFQAALQLVDRIDARLSNGRPYRDRAGQVLADLGDVVRAILEDNLQPQEEPVC